MGGGFSQFFADFMVGRKTDDELRVGMIIKIAMFVVFTTCYIVGFSMLGDIGNIGGEAGILPCIISGLWMIPFVFRLILGMFGILNRSSDYSGIDLHTGRFYRGKDFVMLLVGSIIILAIAASIMVFGAVFITPIYLVALLVQSILHIVETIRRRR